MPAAIVPKSAQLKSCQMRYEIVSRASTPIMDLECGDNIGIYYGRDNRTYPVVMLSVYGHGNSIVIAHSFDDFLEKWQRAYYLFPEFWFYILDEKHLIGEETIAQLGELFEFTEW